VFCHEYESSVELFVQGVRERVQASRRKDRGAKTYSSCDPALMEVNRAGARGAPSVMTVSTVLGCAYAVYLSGVAGETCRESRR
jgi:hypothetical protein